MHLIVACLEMSVAYLAHISNKDARILVAIIKSVLDKPKLNVGIFMYVPVVPTNNSLSVLRSIK